MTQIFIDDKGIQHEFPDDATPEEIDAATRSGSSGPPDSGTGAESTSPPLATPPLFSREHLLQTLSQVGSHTNDELRALNRGLTLGGWDNLVGGIKYGLGVGSPAEERQKTAEARSRLPFNGMVPEMAGTALTSALTEGLLGPGMLTSSLPRTMATGSVMSGTQAEMDRKDPSQVLLDMGIGAGTSGILHGATKGASKLYEKLTGTSPPPPASTSSEDLSKMTDDQWNAIKEYAYPRTALDTINTAAQADAKNAVNSTATGQPLTETSGDKATRKLFDKFDERFNIPSPTKGQTGKPGTPVWPSEVEKWRADAANLGTPHGDALAARLDELTQTGPTLKLAPLGGKAEPLTPEANQQNTDTVYQGILDARNLEAKRRAVEALEQAQVKGTNTPITAEIHSQTLPQGIQAILEQANRGNALSRAAETANRTLPGMAKAAMFPLAGALGATGHLLPAGATAGGAFVAEPVTRAITQPLSDLARARMLQAAKDQITGAFRPRPDTSAEDAFRRMLLGAWTSQQQ